MYPRKSSGGGDPYLVQTGLVEGSVGDAEELERESECGCSRGAELRHQGEKGLGAP